MKTVAEQIEEHRKRYEGAEKLPPLLPTCLNPVPDEEVRHNYQAATEEGVLWQCTECKKQLKMKLQIWG